MEDEQTGDSTSPEREDNTVLKAIEELSKQVKGLSDRMHAVENPQEPAAETSSQEKQWDNNGRSPEVRGEAAIPSAREICRDYEVGHEVNCRLAGLGLDDDYGDTSKSVTQTTRGKKSGAARMVQDTVVNDIDWPHFHIYTSPGAEAMTFEGLSVQEFTFGFMHMIDQPEACFDRQIMWDILKNMIEDATEYPWTNVWNFFWVVGSHVENNRLAWTDTVQIQ